MKKSLVGWGTPAPKQLIAIAICVGPLKQAPIYFHIITKFTPIPSATVAVGEWDGKNEKKKKRERETDLAGLVNARAFALNPFTPSIKASPLKLRYVWNNHTTLFFILKAQYIKY